MTIDYTGEAGFESTGVSLAYLFMGVYHDENGVERRVHWCGPKNRVGSGLIASVPPHPNSRGGGASTTWESRLSRCSLSADLGPLSQNIQTVTDLNFNVDLSGGPNAAPPVPGDLLRDVVFGRWAHKRAYLWLYELGSGNTQLVATGFFDKNPTSINANVFQVTVAADPITPEVSWPGVKMPSSATGLHGASIWSHSGGASNTMIPDVYPGLNPSHVSMFMGPTFGNSEMAQLSSTPVGEDPAGNAMNFWGWREAIPYGWNNRTGGPDPQRWIFCLVAIEPGAVVQEVYWQNSYTSDEGVNMVTPAETWDTLGQEDPDAGPLGVVIRFSIPYLPASSANFVWWQQPFSRVFVRLSGASFGEHTNTENGVKKYTYNSLRFDRSDPATILEDLTSEPHYLKDALEDIEVGLSSRIWGTNALADFAAAAPGDHQYRKTVGPVPKELTDRPMPLRQGLQELAASFPFDIVQRWDAAVDEMRLYPIWRTTFADTPVRIITTEQCAKTDPPQVTQLNDPDGHYANYMTTVCPERYGEPNWQRSPTAPYNNNSDEIQRDALARKFGARFASEWEPEKEGVRVAGTNEWRFWQHQGDSGNADAAWMLAMERAQPQRVIQATHGVRSFDLPMGAPIQYDMVGVNDDVGMIRKMRFDYDLQVVQVTSYHVDHASNRRVPKTANEDGKETYRQVDVAGEAE